MIQKVIRSLILVSMVMFSSCKYKTHVINTVHKNGSVTRKVIMRNNSNYFEPRYYAVPIDSSWQVEITPEVNENKDTSWFLTAVKRFESVDEINEEYEYDIGANRGLKRTAVFSKSYRWFTTVYRFAEIIEKAFPVACPMSDYLTDEELDFYYLPDNVKNNLKSGPDSISFRKMSDSINVKLDQWEFTCEMWQWTEIFYDLFEGHPKLKISREEMRSKAPQFVDCILNADEDDELDTIVIALLGVEFDTTFREEIEYSVTILEEMENNYTSGRDYDVEIRMPGRIIASSGYAVTDPETGNGSGILWTVKGRYCLTQDYEMWVESRVNNYFVWIITGLFILFVTGGFILYRRQ